MNNLLKIYPWTVACCLVPIFVISSFAQKNQQQASLCSREGALELVQQQITLSKTIDSDVKRIAVLIRAADLLWPHQNEKARAAFDEAFEIAKRDYKAKGDQLQREGVGLVSTPPDQRYVVINAIAKRDLAWARWLTEQTLKELPENAQETASDSHERAAERLLSIASGFAPTDPATALAFAGRSLRYPATLYLPLFLYKLSETNRAAADQFYREALAAYANAAMQRFLYLSSYPFGNEREAGETPGYTIYKIPEGFTPNVQLQRLFVETLLRRVQQFIEHPTESAPGVRVPEIGQMWIALTHLYKQIQNSLPDLVPAVEAAKASWSVRMENIRQRRMAEIVSQRHPPGRSFDEEVEQAEKSADPVRRDILLVMAVLGPAVAREDLDKVLAVVDKISDGPIRGQVQDWLHFNRAQSTLKEKRLDEARRLAKKVGELDQRSYLYSQIAEESFKQQLDPTQAREMLEEIVYAASKAPTVTSARALLAAAYLYTKVDVNRAIAVLSETVKTINQIERPDFSSQFVGRRIEGKEFGSYAMFQTPGFSPENAFREIGKADFDGALYQASQFADKPLRALVTLALVESCLRPATVAPPKTTKKNKG